MVDLILVIVAYTLLTAGLFCCIVPIFPGAVVAYAGMVCAYFCDDMGISIGGWSLVSWGVITLIVTALDYILPAYMAKLLGGSRAGQWGATLGLFIALIISFFIPIAVLPQILASLIGPMFGAIIGEMIHNRKDFNHACKVGVGSFFSFIVGMGLKLIVIFFMLMHLTITVIW